MTTSRGDTGETGLRLRGDRLGLRRQRVRAAAGGKKLPQGCHRHRARLSGDQRGQNWMPGSRGDSRHERGAGGMLLAVPGHTLAK